MKKNTLSRRGRNIMLLSAGIIIAGLLYGIAAAGGFGIPCLFYKFTGLMCPGCGNSRAALALLRLDFAAALRYNLLFPLEFFYLFWVFIHCCKAYLKGKRFSYKPPYPVMDILILAIILLWGIVRNCI